MMKMSVKCSAVLSCLLLTSFALARPASAKTIAYPGPEHASFLVDAPEDWEITPGENEGDYMDLTGPTGVVISMRTIEGAEGLKEAIAESEAFLKENYDNVTVTPPQASTQRGLKGFIQTGGGKDKEDGHEVGFAMAWYDLPDGKIGEIWYVVTKGDEGRKVAVDVLGSFRAP